MKSVQCENCGTENNPKSIFCSRCSSKLLSINDEYSFFKNFTIAQGKNFDLLNENEAKALKSIEMYIRSEFNSIYNDDDYYDEDEYVQLTYDQNQNHVSELVLMYFSEISNFDFSVFEYLFKIRIYFPPIQRNNITNSFIEQGNYGYFCPEGISRPLEMNFPESLTQCSNLERITFENVPLINVPKSIKNLTTLRTFTLYNTDIRELPEEIGLLESLKDIYIFNGHITDIPETIGNLQSLQTLKINKNPLLRIPESIQNCSNLIKIEFLWTKLDDLPTGLFNHPYLTNLFKKRYFIGSPITTNPKYKHLLKENRDYGSFKALLYFIFIMPDLMFFAPFLLFFDPYYKRYRSEFSDLTKDNKSLRTVTGRYFLLPIWLIFSILFIGVIILFFPIFAVWYIKKKLDIRNNRKRVNNL